MKENYAAQRLISEKTLLREKITFFHGEELCQVRLYDKLRLQEIYFHKFLEEKFIRLEGPVSLDAGLFP